MAGSVKRIVITIDVPTGVPVKVNGATVQKEAGGGDEGAYHRWTPEERAYLISVHGERDAATLARELKVSAPAIHTQVSMLRKKGFFGLTCGDCEEAENEVGETTYCSREQGLVRKDRPMCVQMLAEKIREVFP